MRFQVLITPRMMPGGAKLLRCFVDGARRAGIDVKAVTHYRFMKDTVLVTYGMGGADRLPYAMDQLARGGRLVVFDAGYWHRKLSDMQRCYRVSIDGLHPPTLIMRGGYRGADRWNESGLSITHGGDATGPVLLVGNAPKSIAIGAMGWTQDMAVQIRATFPDRQIAFRPKPKKPAEKGIDYDSLSTGNIDMEVAKASLVVCRHSNVAVDACRSGVPVVCQDGAAAAIYPRTLATAANQPDTATRREFLHRLAWWQWSPAECLAGDIWPWLTEVLSEELQ
jgi:hypothetical protein